MELSRAELKFLITFDEYIKLRTQLRAIMDLDLYAKETSNEYYLESIYFDDLYDSRLFEKSDGLEYHQKFRIRDYENGVSRLEYKTKIGNMTNKSTVWLSIELRQALLDRDYSVIEQHLDKPLIEDLYVRMKTDDMKPVVLITYSREAYVYPHGDIRITFDKNVEAARFDQDKRFRRKVFEPKYLMLEVKYSGLMPEHIRTIVFQKDFQQIAYSKYYMGWLLVNA